MSAGLRHHFCEHSRNSRCPGGLCILLHTRCGSSPWGSSQNSDHYTAERTPSWSLRDGRERVNRGQQHARVHVYVCLNLRTHGSDTGPCSGPSSNLCKICGTALRDGQRGGGSKTINNNNSKGEPTTVNADLSPHCCGL